LSKLGHANFYPNLKLTLLTLTWRFMTRHL